MAEEKQPDLEPEINSDDLGVLRVLLHNIKGISAVSTVSDFATFDDDEA